MTTLIPKYDVMNGGSTPTGAINRAINLKLNEFLSVLDFGADNTGVTDCSSAINNAITAANGQKNIYFPKGSYKFSVTITNPALATMFYGENEGSILIPLSASAPCFVLQYTGTSGGSFLQFKFKQLNFTDSGTQTSCAIWSIYTMEIVDCHFNNLKYGILGNSCEWSRFDACYFNRCLFGVYATTASAANDPLGFGSTVLINPSEWYFTNCWFDYCNCSYFEEQVDNPYEKDNHVMFTSCQIIGGNSAVVVIQANIGCTTFLKCWFEGRSGTETGITVRGVTYPSCIIYSGGTSIDLIDCRDMTAPNPVYVYNSPATPNDYINFFRMSGTNINGAFVPTFGTNVISTIKDCNIYNNNGYSLVPFTNVKNVVPLLPVSNSGTIFNSTVWPIQQVQGSATGPFLNLWTKGSCAGATSNVVGSPTVAITSGDGLISSKYLSVTNCANGDGLSSGTFTSVTNAFYVITFALKQTSGIGRTFFSSSFGYANGINGGGYFIVPSDGNWHSYTVISGCVSGGTAGGATLTNASGTSISFGMSAIQVVQFPNLPQALQYAQSGIYTLPVVL